MVIFITGASHTGKTLLENYKIPYLSIDHLKMGLIRSGNTDLTPEDDDKLTSYLWPIIREIAKTVIENHQDLTIEGGYIPFDWKKDFQDEYLKEIRYCCLIMSKGYIVKHFQDIQDHANEIESRLDDTSCTIEALLDENAANLEMCKQYGLQYILIDEEYKIDIHLS